MQNKKRVAVIVMGELDRSPRMVNHALSAISYKGLDVDFIGYRGQSLP